MEPAAGSASPPTYAAAAGAATHVGASWCNLLTTGPKPGGSASQHHGGGLRRQHLMAPGGVPCLLAGPRRHRLLTGVASTAPALESFGAVLRDLVPRRPVKGPENEGQLAHELQQRFQHQVPDASSYHVQSLHLCRSPATKLKPAQYTGACILQFSSEREVTNFLQRQWRDGSLRTFQGKPCHAFLAGTAVPAEAVEQCRVHFSCPLFAGHTETGVRAFLLEAAAVAAAQALGVDLGD